LFQFTVTYSTKPNPTCHKIETLWTEAEGNLRHWRQTSHSTQDSGSGKDRELTKIIVTAF